MTDNNFAAQLDYLALGSESTTYAPLYSVYPPPTTDVQTREYFTPAGVWGNLVRTTKGRPWFNDPSNFIWDEASKLYRGFAIANGIQGSTPRTATTWMELVSPDMIEWTPFDLPFPMTFRDGTTDLYGGSIVVDTNNTAGFSPGAVLYFISRPGLVETPDQQGISLFVSPAPGMKPVFVKNVMISPPVGVNGMRAGSGFRDSRVEWLEEAQLWLCAMTVDYGHVFYTSPDALNWTFLQAVDLSQYSQIECPSPARIYVEGYGYKWYLIFSFKNYQGQYRQCVGYLPMSWNGTNFTFDSMVPQLLNYGGDYYAQAVSVIDGTAYMWAWLGDWAFSAILYTQGFSNAISVVSKLVGSYDPSNGFTLKCQWLEGLKDRYAFPVIDYCYKAIGAGSPYTLPTKTPGTSYMLEFTFVQWTPYPWADSITISICSGPTGHTDIILDLKNLTLSLDRSASGHLPIDNSDTSAIDLFKTVRGGPIKERGCYVVKVIFDVSVVEIMLNDGDAYISSVILPTEDNFGVTVSASGDGYALLNATALYL